MFEWLFGNRSANVGTPASESSDVDSLLKHATAQKRCGDLVGAIRTLQLAYRKIASGPITYSVDTFLRLPLYLQEAGRNDEAWSEFNRLIVEGHPNQLIDSGVQAMENSKVYDKMRLFLQREGNYVEAIVFGALSMLAVTRGLYLQKRQGELAKFVSRKRIEAKLEPLLKKDGRGSLSGALVKIMLEEVGDPSQLDLNRAAKRMRELLVNAASN